MGYHRIRRGAVSAAVLGLFVASVLADTLNNPLSSQGLALRSGFVDTAKAPNLLHNPPTAFERGSRHVLQLNGPMTPARRAALEAAGVVLHDYLAENAYIVELDAASPTALAGLDFASWLGEYRNEWKLDPTIGQRLAPFQTPERIALAQQGLLELTVVTFAGYDLDMAQTRLANLGATVLEGHVVGGLGTTDVIVSPDRLADLAAEPCVQFVEEASEITLRNNSNRWIVQSNVVNVTPLYDNGITGVGQIIGILDSQVNEEHCAFYDSNPIGPTHRKIEAYNTSFGYGSHGTHVAGIAVGDGGAFDNNRGIAYLGRLVYNTIPSFTETAVDNALTLHHNQGARIHTNSWGDDGTTAYNSLARGFDVFQYYHPDSLCVLAVTNTSTLKNPENAKNLLAVGASQDTPNQDSHCSGGTGPTADGRRKPEIYAPGCGTVSCTGDGTSCSTTSLTGTSMACPAVAGTAMLVREYYVDGYYPSGVATPADAFIPSAALIKATLLNSAVDMTGISGYPSNLEGWGRVLADNALYFPGDSRGQIVFDVNNASGLITGGSAIYDFSVASSTEPLRVTLVFTDVPGTAGASDPMVNNLDLEVTAPDGITVYKGNVFSGGQSTTGGSADAKNNVEQVLLLYPTAGVHSIQVKGTAVNQGVQGYALVVTGDVNLGPAPPKSEDVSATTPVDNATLITLVATDVDGDPMDFIITTLPAHGDLSDPGAGAITAVPYTLVGEGNQVTYTPDPGYQGNDALTFKANDGGVPPDGGDSNTSDVSILVLANPPMITTTTLPDGALNVEYGPLALEASDGQLPLTWSLLTDLVYVEQDLATNGFAEAGAAQEWHGDDAVYTYNLPFDFPFYGTTFDSLKVSCNGFVNFGTIAGSTALNSLTLLKQNKRIAVLWDDLKTYAPNDIFVDTSVAGQVTIRWKAITYAGSYPVNVAMTLIDDGKIRFHYGGGNTNLTPTVGVSAGDEVHYLVASYDGDSTLTDADSLELDLPDGMPEGMTLDGSGSLSGTPIQSGDFEPVFKVTDSQDRSDEKLIPLHVAPFAAGDHDADDDGDVDLRDFWSFQACFTGDGQGPAASGCEVFYSDPDTDVDLTDLSAFLTLLDAGGPN